MHLIRHGLRQSKLLPFGRLILALASTACSAGAVRGEPVTFYFEGMVLSVEQVHGPVTGVTWPSAGAPFRGSYTFESTTPDTGGPNSGVYTTPGPPDGPGFVRVEVGQFQLEGGGAYVVTHEVPTPPPGTDIYEAGNWLSNMEFVSHAELNATLNHNHFQLRIDGDTNLLDGLDLPLTPPSLAHATEATLSLWLDNGLNTTPAPYVMITGALTSLHLGFMPEPNGATIGVLLMGSLILRRRMV